MHRPVMLLCALALGTAVKAAPAPHPDYAPVSDPYADPVSTPYVDPYYTPPSYVDPGYYAPPSSYVDPAYYDPTYYSTPTYDPYYTTPSYVDPGYYSTPPSYVDPGYYTPPSYVDPAYYDPTYYSTPTYDPYYTTPSYVDPGYYSTPSSYVDPAYYTTPTDPYYPSYTPPSDPYYTTPSDPYYTVASDPNYSTPSDPYYVPGSSDAPVDKPTYSPYTPNTKSTPSHPFCHLKIITFLIKLVFEGQSDYFKEYPYLLYTPSDSATGFSYGSIGKSLEKANAHPAVLYVTSGDLDEGTASLGEYYKGYPHHTAPSYDEAYYLWIIEEIIVIVYFSLDPPSYADYTKFGVNSEKHLTYNGREKWALCPPSGIYGSYDTDTLDLYWIGNSEYPSGCIQDVHLYLVPYGFPYPEDTYYRNRKGIKSPTDTSPPSYYPPSEVAGVPAQPPYSTPSYPIVEGVPASPSSYYYPPIVAPAPVYPPYTTPGYPIVGGVPASPSSYYYPPTAAPVPAYPPYSTPVYPLVDDTPVTMTTVYSPVYTDIVDGEPVTYDTGFYDEILTES